MIIGISGLKGKSFKRGYIRRNNLGRECCPARQIGLPRGIGDTQPSVIQVREKHQ